MAKQASSWRHGKCQIELNEGEVNDIIQGLLTLERHVTYNIEALGLDGQGQPEFRVNLHKLAVNFTTILSRA